MINYDKIKELGELALIISIDNAYRETLVSRWDYFEVDHYRDYHNDTDGIAIYDMQDFDYEFGDYSPLDVAEAIERAEWFSVEDDYFVIEDFGVIRSMDKEEVKGYYEERTNMLEFIKWANETDRYDILHSYLQYVQSDLGYRLGVNTVIIEF